MAGVSGFQIHFSSHDIHTPADKVDLLVAFNPAALRATEETMAARSPIPREPKTFDISKSPVPTAVATSVGSPALRVFSSSSSSSWAFASLGDGRARIHASFGGSFEGRARSIAF